MNMSSGDNLQNRVKETRLVRGWSQDELAIRSGLSRSGISAIEIQRLVPSAAAALALAKAFDCRVEDLFSLGAPPASWEWAALPTRLPTRFWQAEVAGRRLLYPAEMLGEVALPHDGMFDGQTLVRSGSDDPAQTLVMACCDPAVGLLVHELARRANFRLLVIPRSSGQALALLRDRVVHVAGVHLSHADGEGNQAAVAHALGQKWSFQLLRAAHWEEGVALAPERRVRSVGAALASRLRWIGRENGSGAQQCLQELRGERPAPRHQALSHRGVAEAIRAGLVDAGVCLRLVSDQAGLDFLSVRREAYDLCFSAEEAHDPRIRALIDVVQSPAYRQLISELPGYSTADAGTLRAVSAKLPTSGT